VGAGGRHGAAQHPRQLHDAHVGSQGLHASARGIAGAALDHPQVLVCVRCHLGQMGDANHLPRAAQAAQQRPDRGRRGATDADVNLLDAIRVAAAPQSCGRGALIVMNNEVHAAREATKSSTFRLETFHPKELGFLGYADSDGEVVFYRAIERRHTTQTEFDADGLGELPRVEILDVYAGADGALVMPAVERGATGLVIAGAGAGSMPPPFLEATVRAVARGVAVVVSSRTGNGRVIERGWMERQGLVLADNLTPQKARVLLMLGLTRSTERRALQRMYETY